MAIINRISRLFKADFHAVLDCIEEPDILLRQAVREMEEALMESEQQIKRMEFDQARLLAQQVDAEEGLNRMDEALAMCFESNNEALARGLIKRKLEAQLYVKILLRKRESVEKALREAHVLFKENQARYESMRQKSELLAEECMCAGFGSGANDVGRFDSEFLISADEIEIAFLKERQRFDQRGNRDGHDETLHKEVLA